MKLLNKLINKLKLPRITDYCIESMKQLNTPPKIKVIDVELNFPKEVTDKVDKEIGNFIKKQPKVYINNKEIK